MDTGLQSSFIPKKPVFIPQKAEGSRVGIFMIISLVVLILAGAGSAGVFFYTRYLQNSIAQADVSLSRAKEAFDPNIIKTMTRLDSRIQTGKKLLSSHVAVSPVFDLLGKLTLKNSVRFKSFDMLIARDKITLSMKGQATGFTAIALQSDEFGKEKRLQNALLSDLALDQTGAVSFSFVSTVNPQIISYKNSRTSGKTAVSDEVEVMTNQ